MPDEMIPPCEDKDSCWQLGQIDLFHALAHWMNFYPHPAQQQIIDGLRKETTVVAGRRFGKSVLCGALMLYDAMTHKDFLQYVIAPSQDQSKIVFSEVRKLAFESPMIHDYIVSSKDFPFPEISFKSGSIIYARSVGMNEGKYLRGHKAHKVYLDEAPLIPDNVVNTVIAPLLTDYDGDMFKIGTPLGQIGHFYTSYNEGMKGTPGYAAFHFTSFDNPHISHDYIRRQKAVITDLQYRVEYMGEFVNDEVCVFRWDSITDATMDYAETFEPEKGHQYYVGIDIARVHDYSSITVIDGTNPKSCKVAYTERFSNKPFSFLLDRIFAITLQFQPVRILVDETGVGEGPTEQILSEFPIAEGFKFSMQSKASLINSLKTGLEQRRLKISSENQNLINELRFYEYKLMEDSGNVKMSAPAGKFDDCVISLALSYLKCAVIYADVALTSIEPKPQPLNSNDNSLVVIGDTFREQPTDYSDFIGRWV
jgi:hypothetical protein